MTKKIKKVKKVEEIKKVEKPVEVQAEPAIKELSTEQKIQDIEECLDKVCEILIHAVGVPASELKKWWNE